MVLETIKQTVGIGQTETKPTYECDDCGTTFESGMDPDSAWFDCKNCNSENVERVN